MTYQIQNAYLLFSITLSLIVISIVTMSTNVDADQSDMEKMMEMMKESGMSPEQAKQMEEMMGGMVKKEEAKKAQQVEKEKQEFNAAYGNNPIAHLDIDGTSYTLRVTECKRRKCRRDRTCTGKHEYIYSMSAKQPPGEDDISLWVGCCEGNFDSGGVSINSPDWGMEGSSKEAKFNSGNYELVNSLMVGDIEGGQANVSIRLSCEGLL